MKSFVIAVAAIVGIVVAGVAQSTSNDVEIRHKEVHFADLNLNHPAGAEHLHRRIRLAARQLCGEPNHLVTARLDEARRCADEATAKAVARVNSPVLTKYHASL